MSISTPSNCEKYLNKFDLVICCWDFLRPLLDIMKSNPFSNRIWISYICDFTRCLRIRINSSFVWNWCKVSPDKITKSNHFWLRRSISSIINPFLRVLSISAFLRSSTPQKPLKPSKKRVESGASKINFPHSNFYILAIGTSHGLYKHPHVKG